MIQLNEIYYCKLCKNLVEAVGAGNGTLVCCGEQMVRLAANSQDAATEKHVPVVVEKDGGVEVTVGSVEHPMTEEHYITFIEVITEKSVCRKILKPGEKPTAFFGIPLAQIKEVREFCNLHMLWKK